MQLFDIKTAAHQLIDRLPDGCTWKDVLRVILAHQEINLGLTDSDAGRTTSVDDVRKEFGIR